MRTLLLLGLALLTTAPTLAQTTYRIASRESEVKYYASHPAHSWDATSRQAQGEVRTDATGAPSRIAITIPVMSFDSGNRNRDSNMGEETEAFIYPNVTFESTRITVQDGGVWQVEGNLTFHGVTRPLALPVQVTQTDAGLTARGEFEITMSAFGIRPPSLLMVRSRDWLKLTFTLVGQK